MRSPTRVELTSNSHFNSSPFPPTLFVGFPRAVVDATPLPPVRVSEIFSHAKNVSSLRVSLSLSLSILFLVVAG